LVEILEMKKSKDKQVNTHEHITNISLNTSSDICYAPVCAFIKNV
jgi:hypothetical protein